MQQSVENSQRPLGAFTVDVEDYYQVSAFEGGIDRSQWSVLESRVVPNTQRLLALLQKHGVTATFFILGWVAEHFPELVREIHDAGHEVGSHSYWHRLIYTQTPDEFREDLRRSRDVLQDIIGAPVTAYRAPSFSITEKSKWALEILVEEGFRSDSSVFPIVHDRYGMPGADPRIHSIHTGAGELIEFPPSVVKIGRLNLPVGGGGYFRLYPSRLTRWGLSLASIRGTHPFMFYIHPWEVDPQQPRLQVASRASRFRHYVGLSSTERKLDNLLRHFRFASMGEVLDLSSSRNEICANAPS